MATTAVLLVLANACPAQKKTTEKRDLATVREAPEVSKKSQAHTNSRKVLEGDSSVVSAIAEAGMLEYAQGNYPQAISSFRRVLRVSPTAWSAKALLGLSLVKIGDEMEALEAINSSFPHLSDPKLKLDAGLTLVRVNERRGTIGAASSTMAVLSHEYPDDPKVLYAAYRMYSDLASQSVQRLLEKDPASAELHLVRAQAYLTENQFAEAISEDELALKAEPSLRGIHYEIGRAALLATADGSGRVQAREQFKAELTADPNDAASIYELGELDFVAGEFTVARDEFASACRIRPDFADAQVGWGKSLLALGDAKGAIVALEHAARLEPNSAVVHYRLAQVDSRLGRSEEAAAELSAFRRLKEIERSGSLSKDAASLKNPTEQNTGTDED